MSALSCGCDPEENYIAPTCTVHSTSNVQSTTALEAPPPKPKILSQMEIRRIGAMQVEDLKDEALDKFVEQQREVYQEVSRAELIETLLDRDRQLALEGRQLADGRIGGRLLREFVRGILSGLDSKDPQKIERMLLGMGAEPADLRQLRKQGTTLGPEDSQEDRDRKFHGQD